MKFAAKVFALIAFLLCCSFVCDAFVVPSAPSSVAQRRVSALSNSLKYFPKDASRAGLVNTRMMVKADPRVSTQPPTESVVAFEETTRRSFVKALAWRITAGIITFITSFSIFWWKHENSCNHCWLRFCQQSRVHVPGGKTLEQGEMGDKRKGRFKIKVCQQSHPVAHFCCQQHPFCRSLHIERSFYCSQGCIF
ncbi:unnamed protein product [Heterosigma akashiwo]